jgi:putative DNA primase/helicase
MGAADYDATLVLETYPDCPIGNGNAPEDLKAWLTTHPEVSNAIARIDPEGPPPEPDKGILDRLLDRLSDFDDETLLEAGAEDEGNAQAVAEVYGRDFLHVAAYGWMLWTGTHWASKNAEALLDRAVVETLKARRVAAVIAEDEKVVRTAKPSAHRVRACKYLLSSILLEDVSAFDAAPHLLNTQSGVVDLRSGEVTPHDPTQRFTYCCPVSYNPGADRKPWLDFLTDALGGDPGVLEYVQEAVGYSLTGSTREETFFYVHGPTRAGKGTFTETLLAMTGGRPLADEVDFSTFTADRTGDTQNFDLAGLKPCRLIVASESGKYSKLNAAKVKAMTGGNEIRCAHKHQPFFSYRPQFKIWLVSNHPINADVDDDAAWYRVKVIEFPNSYAGQEDKTLKERLRQPEALAGVLAWAVEGAIRWYGRGKRGLDTPSAVQKATDKARRDLDYVGQWLEEQAEITGDDADFASNKEIYASYSAWCDENGVTPKHKRSLTIALKKKGLDAGTRRYVSSLSKQVRGCTGIILFD